MNPRVSIIIPVLNEAENIPAMVAALPAGAEVIAVDGGSTDTTLRCLQAQGITTVTASKGRANQMNEGARRATGDVFVFLHADTRLPEDTVQLMEQLDSSGKGWGRFDVRLSGRHPAFRLIELMMNWRSRLTGICTGDQAIFITRHLFERVEGFPPIPLMEDIAVSKRLKGIEAPWCLRDRAVTSSRRWEENGILRTILLMWRLRLGYFFGVEPETLVRRYYP